MARIPMWRRYLRFWGSDVRADVDAELGFHVDALTERLVRDGRDPAEARAEAARRFGDYARAEAACVEIDQGWERQRRWRQLVADLWQDLRIGGRTLAKNPGFTISAVVVLGLGLGAAITMLSVINAVFVRPLPFPEPDRIVSVVRQDSRFRGVNQFHPQRSVAFLRDRGRAFSVLAGIGVSPGVNLVSEHGSTYIRNIEVTAGYFQVFGVVPRLGRPFSRDDEAAPSTVVLSHDIWIDHFGGDPEIVGRDVRLGGRPHTVIGVMPRDFWSFEEAEAWTPFRPDPDRGDQNYRLIGRRLAPGWTEPQAEAELQALAIGLDAELPAAARDEARLRVRSHHDQLAAGSNGLVWPLTAAVVAVLMLVCANAAGLHVARAVGRRRELAVRAALGGRRGRLLRQLLTESVLLATAGGAAGALAAAGGIRGLVALAAAPRGLGHHRRRYGAVRGTRDHGCNRRGLRVAARSPGGAQRARARAPRRTVAERDHRPCVLDASVARGFTGRPVHGAAGGGGRVSADVRRTQHVGSRIRSRQRAHRPRIAPGARVPVG